MLDNVANKFFKGNKNVAFIVIAAGAVLLSWDKHARE